MNLVSNLAIVIPAYKITYLEKTLSSLALQTNKMFNVYIGDDSSPNNLQEVVKKFETSLSITYVRFKQNLGSTDLVAQWKRCIEMINNEEWIWLFSDDDELDDNCVELFYRTQHNNPHQKLFHFNIIEIDEVNGKLQKQVEFPLFMDSKQFLISKLKGDVVSYVVEFIFHKDLYIKCNGFTNFDLAWGSDFITWLRFSENSEGILTIPMSYVYWRRSNENISPNKTTPILQRKIFSLIQNGVQIKKYLIRNNIMSSFFYFKFIWGEIIRNADSVSLKMLIKFYIEYLKNIGYIFQSTMALFFALVCHFFPQLKQLIISDRE